MIMVQRCTFIDNCPYTGYNFYKFTRKGELKMKKIIALLLLNVMCFSLIACGENSGKTDSTNVKEMGTSDFESTELNNTITNEFVELAFTKTKITHAANEKETGLSLQDEEEMIWFIIFGNIKNIDVSEIDFANGLKAELVLDEKYTYPVSITPNHLYSVVPLKKEEFAIYASVPEEVLESCENYSFRFGFNDSFEMGLDMESSKYKYEINGILEEYGSVESIENFRTFSEYLEKLVSDKVEEGYKARILDEYSKVEIYNNFCNTGKVNIDDGTTFYIFPRLDLSYILFSSASLYDDNVVGYGELVIAFETLVSEDDIYIGAKTIKITSDNGEIKLGEEPLERSFIDRGEVEFNFDSEKLSFDDLKHIFSGDNLQMSFVVEVSGGSDIVVEYECTEEMQSTLIALTEIYQGLPNAGWL